MYEHKIKGPTWCNMSGPAIEDPRKRVDLLMRLNNPPEPAKLKGGLFFLTKR
jgi:hypothetical protein